MQAPTSVSQRMTLVPFSVKRTTSSLLVSCKNFLATHNEVFYRSEKVNNSLLIFTDMGVFENAVEKVVQVESGRAAILDFPHIDSEPPPSVIWQEENSVNGVLRYDQKYAITDKHQLVILCASPEDQRAYR